MINHACAVTAAWTFSAAPRQKSQCRLPTSGRGLLNLKGGVVIAGKEWTNDGAVHEIHSLQRRAARATRPVPIPPVLVRMLREHIRSFGVAPDGRLFRNVEGNYTDASAYGITWRRAREVGLTLDEHALELAMPPYDLRHAGISFWLASGVDPAACAPGWTEHLDVLGHDFGDSRLIGGWPASAVCRRRVL
ncbi:hypothetical protein ABZ800_35625 [Streptomyces sp. NPDC047813]|uniref:hypothetical protein n=1 Tax=Streptomyces sp. NPDC047813 TaxID=3154608 RepID=UPI003409050C